MDANTINQMKALFENAVVSQNCIETEGVDRHPGRNELRVTRSQRKTLEWNTIMNSDDDDYRHLTQS